MLLPENFKYDNLHANTLKCVDLFIPLEAIIVGKFGMPFIITLGGCPK